MITGAMALVMALQGPTLPAEVEARLRLLRELGFRGSASQPSHLRRVDGPLEIGTEIGLTYVRIGDFRCRLDSAFNIVIAHTGRESVGDYVSAGPPLSRELFEIVLRDYASAALGSANITLDHRLVSPPGGLEIDEATFSPWISGVAVDPAHATWGEFEASSGRFLTLHFQPLPLPPKKLVAKTTADEARAAALSYLAKADRPRMKHFMASTAPPPVVQELVPPSLRIWKPAEKEFDDNEVFLESSHKEDAKEGRGSLIWLLHYVVPDSYSSAYRNYTVHYSARVDALTGKLLCFIQATPAGGGGGTRLRGAGVFGWNLHGTIGVRSRASAVAVPRAKIDFVKETVKDGRKLPLWVQLGRAYVRASYDSASNLLYTENRYGGSYGRPSMNLATVLKKLGSAADRKRVSTLGGGPFQVGRSDRHQDHSVAARRGRPNAT